jgi:hypothetical protein
MGSSTLPFVIYYFIKEGREMKMIVIESAKDSFECADDVTFTAIKELLLDDLKGIYPEYSKKDLERLLKLSLLSNIVGDEISTQTDYYLGIDRLDHIK